MKSILTKILPQGFLIKKSKPPVKSLIPSNYELSEGWVFDCVENTIEYL